MTEQICRLCLSSEIPKLGPLEAQEMSQKILKFLEIEIAAKPHMPQSVCELCGSQVLNFFEFYEKVHENQAFLEHQLEKPPTDFKLEDFEESSHHSADNTTESSPRRSYKKAGRQKREKEDALIAKYITFSCKTCEVGLESSFGNMDDWKFHMRQVHDVAKPIVLCCNRRLINRVRILKHIEYHHELDPGFKCPHCDKSYKRQGYLDQHMKSHGLQEIRYLQCDQCEEKFLYKSQLLKHQISHMPPEEAQKVELPQCPECLKTFVTKQNMQTHRRRTHNQKQQFICENCAQIFSKKERLAAHVLYKHSKDPPVHKCPECGVVCASQTTFKRHLRWYHSPGGGQETWECDVCGVKKPNEMSLKQHRKFVHETPRNFACQYCPKKFKRQIELTEHLTIHLGGSLYSCPHCDRKFNSKSNMQTHAKRRCPAAAAAGSGASEDKT